MLLGQRTLVRIGHSTLFVSPLGDHEQVHTILLSKNSKLMARVLIDLQCAQRQQPMMPVISTNGQQSPKVFNFHAPFQCPPATK